MRTPHLLLATVGHERFSPKKNKFAYQVYYVALPVTEEEVVTPRLFSFNRFNILSVYTHDHGARTKSTSWRAWIHAQCAEHGFPLTQEHTVTLIAHPRLFGYAFNPISYWLIQNPSGALVAVLCEVHNTFGSDHNYLLFHEDHRPILPQDTFSAVKKLYVSPFNTVPPGSYTFTFTATDERFASVINYFEQDVHLLNTYMGGAYTPLTSWAIAKLVVMYPLMTLLVVFRIHFQAIILWYKGVPHTLNSRPPHTSGNTTTGKSS